MIEFDIINKALPNKSELKINGQVYSEPFIIKAIKENSLLTTSVSKLILNFEQCTFHLNVFFQLQLDVFNINELVINFSNCFIFGESKHFHSIIKLGNRNKLSVNYSNCILENIDFQKCEITHLGVNNSVVKFNYLTVMDCNIKSIQIHNLLGKYGIHKCSDSNIHISYSDSNLYLPSKNIREYLKSLGSNYESIFAFPTEISISSPRRFYLDFKKSKLNGFKKSFHGFHYHLKESQTDLLNISLNIQLDEKTESIKLSKALLEGFALRNVSDAMIEILRSSINSVFINDLSFKSFKVYDLSSRKIAGSVFEARNVDFSNATFDKTDLASYEKVNFYRSTLVDINFISPKFPKEIFVLDNIHYPEKKESNYFRMQSENYRQIKKSLLASGNQVEALEIHSKMYASLLKDNQLPSQDRLILWLNGFSNSHGTSILKPLLILLGFSLTFFFIYRFSLNELPHKFSQNGTVTLWDGLLNNLSFAFNDFKAFWLSHDYQENTFFNGEKGILNHGGTMAFTSIFNNKFFSVNQDIVLDGAANYLIDENDFTSIRGVIVSNTGQNENIVLRNSFEGNTEGIFSTGQNPEFQFLQNCFSTNSSDFIHFSGTIPNQGGPNSEAGNCFTHQGTGTNLDIKNFTSQNLIYYLHDDGESNCKDVLNQQILPENGEQNNGFEDCGANFYGGGGGGGGSGETGFNISDCNPNYNQQSLVTALSNLNTQYSSIEGDNSLDELTQNSLLSQYNICISKVEGQLAEYYVSQGEYQNAINIFSTEPNFHDHASILALYVLQHDYNMAMQYLQSLQGYTLEETDFIFTQNMNIRFLESGLNYQFQPTEINTLKTIAEQNNSLSAYAKSLYYALTGVEIFTSFPAVNDESESRNSGNDDKITNIEFKVFPNPVEAELYVNTPLDENAIIEISNWEGRNMTRTKVNGLQSTIDLSDLDPGVYIVKYSNNEGLTLFDKIIKLNK